METEIVELTPSVKLYKVGETNYYLYKGEKNVLIDCGLSCTAKKLLEILEENIDAVLITHGHFDHVGGCPSFSNSMMRKSPPTRV